MPKGYTSIILKSKEFDQRIVEMFTLEFLMAKEIAVIFAVNESTISLILKRNKAVRELKKCSCCKSILEKSQFNKKGTKLHSHCKNCRRLEVTNIEVQRAWANNNRAKLKVYESSKREKNKGNLHKKLTDKFRTSILGYLKAKAVKKSATFKILKYSLAELQAHLESTFLDGMTWENHGLRGWHIDHIKPVAAFDFNSEDDIRECWGLNNLRALWATDNIVKGSFYNGKKHYHGKQSIN